MQESWNIRDLGSILNMVNESYDQEIKGVNSPYLYFGMWKATFRYGMFSIHILFTENHKIQKMLMKTQKIQTFMSRWTAKPLIFWLLSLALNALLIRTEINYSSVSVK